MDIVTQSYRAIESILSISAGLLLFFFRKQFLKANARALRQSSEKLHFPYLERQAKNMESTYMLAVAILVAIILIVAGTFTLVHNI
jgi:preprotein translocase subunit Sec61beta